ncbi:HNH endonuclease [Clostridium algoriphilum]|uniref:HNH endonuclease n=1 Tax=Clostridium algoriphilum TaxID=198347 RepID=UPI001CF34EEF|nr:HNH endonuclease [Clostridium algoriphilum]MCB2294336.1 HNH endonuclease [Clostridium algoriphilum]
MVNCWWIVGNEKVHGFDPDKMKTGELQQYGIRSGHKKRQLFSYFSDVQVGDKVVIYKTDNESIKYISGLGIITEKLKNDIITFKKIVHLERKLWLLEIRKIDALKNLEFLNAKIGPITISKIKPEEYYAILVEVRKNNTIPVELDLSSVITVKDTYSNKLNQDVQKEPSNGLDGIPDRKENLICRVVRDSNLTKTLKKQHEHKCQICGEALELGKGIYYSEAHHIKSLGKPHNGPDIVENIIILCPNHHVLCDYGAMELKIEDIKQRDVHVIGKKYVDYHNKNIYFGDEL